MKNKFFKLAILLALTFALVFTMVACGGGAKTPSDAEGGWDGISWNYKKDTKTLTITGSGKMPSAANEAAVRWAAIRSGVEKVIFVEKDGKFVDNIGDYAFYGMYNLKSVALPKSVTKIGKLAFAYCSSLENITLPEGLTEIGDSAFEMCSKLKSLTLPASVSSIGDRAFAICTSLEKLSFAGTGVFTDSENNESLMKLGKNMFEKCGKLSAITVPTGFKPALEESLKSKVNEVSAEELNKPTETEKPAETQKPTETAKPTETQKPTETEKPAEEENNVGSIIALVILALVIVGICVGAVLLSRSGKKQAKNGKNNAPKSNKK